MSEFAKKDLADVKTEARRHISSNLFDELVSDACLRALKATLPDDPGHRYRLLRLIVKRTAIDLLRKNSATPRHTLRKLRAGTPLTVVEARNILQQVDFDSPEVQNLAQELSPPRDSLMHEQLQLVMASLGRNKPQEFMALVLWYRHGCTYARITEVMGFKGYVRGFQLVKGAIFYLRRRLPTVTGQMRQAA